MDNIGLILVLLMLGVPAVLRLCCLIAGVGEWLVETNPLAQRLRLERFLRENSK